MSNDDSTPDSTDRSTFDPADDPGQDANSGTTPDSTTDTTTDAAAAPSPASGKEVRAARRAQREAERASRAQRKADAARQRAMDAARDGGLFEGMAATSRGESDRDAAATGTSSGTGSDSDTGADSGTDADTGSRTDTDADADGADVDGDGSDSDAAAASAARPSRVPLDPARRKKLTAALAVASVVLLVVAGLATWGYLEARDATAAEQTIADAPTAATDAAREITTQMFTYEHQTVDADLAAVRDRLTGSALTEFVEQSMPAVASAAKDQEANVYATVAAAAPVDVVDAENVKVLVMLNRMVSTKESPEAASSASRLNLSMVNVDGTWKLGELTAL